MAEEEVGIRLSLKERRETAAGLKDVSGELAGVGRQAQSAGRLAGSSSRGFAAMRKTGRAAAFGIKLGFAAALGAGYAAVKLLRSSFSEAREAERVGAVTEARIRSTGKAAGFTAKQIGRLSFAIGKKTSVDDEAIQSGANWLLTFKKIRNEQGKGNKIFSRALSLSTDLATSMAGSNAGVSLKSASVLVGKALNDPIKGMTALTRVGVSFAAGQIERIKAFVEEGKTMAAQKIILRELQSEFGGTAKAQQNMGDKVDFAWGNIQERLGTALLPMLDRFQGFLLRKGIPTLERWLDVFEKKGVPAIEDFVTEARPLANEVLPAVATGLGDIRDFAKAAFPYLKRVVGAFNSMPGWAQKVLIGGGLAAFATSKLTGGGKGIPGMVSSAKPVPVFVTNPGFGAGGGVTGGKPSKIPSLVPLLKTVVAPIAAFTAADWARKKWPSAMPFGDQGFLPKLGLGGGGGKGWLDLFGAGDSSSSGKNPLEIAITRLDSLAEGRKSLEDLLIKPLGIANTHTKSLGFELDRVGRSKPAPTFTTPGLDIARMSSKDFVDTLHNVPPRVSTEFQVAISGAMANINTVTTAANNALNGLWGGGGSSTGGGGSTTTPRPQGSTLPRTHARQPELGRSSVPVDGTPMVFQVMLDGQVIGERVLQYVSDKGARM